MHPVQRCCMTDASSNELGRREWRRIPINMAVTLNSGPEVLPGRLVDISVGGALFEAKKHRFRFPGPCVLRLPLGTASSDHTDVPATVVRAAGARFALRWSRRFPAHALIKLALPLER